MIANFVSAPETYIEVKVLVEKLKEIPLGGTVSYADLSNAIGRDVQKSGRLPLVKAREIVEKESGTRFGTVHRVGVKRLEYKDMPGVASKGQSTVLRHTRRTIRKISNLSYNDMDEKTTNELRIAKSHLGAIALVCKPSTRKVVEEQVKTMGTEIPPNLILRLLN